MERLSGLNHFDCEVVSKARVKAQQKGLDATAVFCPFIYTCPGTNCIFESVKIKVKPKEHNMIPVNKIINLSDENTQS